MAPGFVRSFLGARDGAAVLPLFIVHFNIVVYAFCFWMTKPLLPFLTKNLGASAVTFGYLQAVFSLVQLVGGTVMGRMSDVVGARETLALSQAGSALVYGMMGVAYSLPILFASQLPSTLMHAMMAAQAFVTDMAAEDSRAAALGRLSLSYGVGMVLGAPFGGWLGDVLGYQHASLVAGAISLAMIPLNYLCLPTIQKQKKGSEGGSQGLNLGRTFTVMNQPGVRPLVVVQLLCGVGLSIFNSMHSMALQERFNISSTELGRLQSLGGIVGVATNTLLVGWMTSTLGEGRSLQICLLTLSLVSTLFAFVDSFHQVIAVVIPFGAASTVFYTTLTTLATRGSGSETGTAISLMHAVRSACGVLAPSLGGYVLKAGGLAGLGGSSASTCLLALVFWSLSPGVGAITAKRD